MQSTPTRSVPYRMRGCGIWVGGAREGDRELGGEGGGTLMNWIVDAAIAAGLPVQSTSVPGVAQRTGSTS